jgi:hypothetical protein
MVSFTGGRNPEKTIDLKKLTRQIQQTQDTEKKTFGAMQKKEYKLNKEQMKRVRYYS